MIYSALLKAIVSVFGVYIIYIYYMIYSAVIKAIVRVFSVLICERKERDVTHILICILSVIVEQQMHVNIYI